MVQREDNGMQSWRIAMARLLGIGEGVSETTQKAVAGPLVAIENLGQPVWAPRDYAAFAREGLIQNPVVYRCVRMIAEAAASVPLKTRSANGMPIEAHPLSRLVHNPSPGVTRSDLFEAAIGYLLVAGNLYIDAAGVGGTIGELHILRPDRVRVIPGADGWPSGYEYRIGASRSIISGEVAPAVPRLMHLKMFHPLSDHYGLSPIEAAATAIDIHNAAGRWNKALLDNAARPSGALVYTSGGQLTGEQFGRLKNELEENFQGAKNAGRPLLLEGGLDWKAMSLSPKDMDFIEAKHAAAREIALALGVPPMLLGIPGDNTYANLQEANRTFWRQTVIPLLLRLLGALTSWLAPAWPQGDVALVPDLDAVEALRSERDALWKRLEAASFLTDDEKRAAVGYGPRSRTGGP
jgi:HK97 family phage portal protein